MNHPQCCQMSEAIKTAKVSHISGIRTVQSCECAIITPHSRALQI
jgi:hypothetical protein